MGYRFPDHVSFKLFTKLYLLSNFLAICKDCLDWVSSSLLSFHGCTTSRMHCWKSLFGRGLALQSHVLN